MSVLNQFILLSEYNQLMNKRLFSAAAQMSADDMYKDNNLFFKSMLGTLNHIMVGDIVWLKRFSVHPSGTQSLSYIAGLKKPGSLDSILFKDLNTLKAEREKVDAIIIQWIKGLSENDMSDCISYNDMAGDGFEKPYASLISHLFLHQVHHRGQATTLLSQYGIDFGETDLIEIIEECNT